MPATIIEAIMMIPTPADKKRMIEKIKSIMPLWGDWQYGSFTSAWGELWLHELPLHPKFMVVNTIPLRLPHA
jgi:hypothetical protein